VRFKKRCRSQPQGTSGTGPAIHRRPVFAQELVDFEGGTDQLFAATREQDIVRCFIVGRSVSPERNSLTIRIDIVNREAVVR
jgi:hypothetical protein